MFIFLINLIATKQSLIISTKDEIASANEFFCHLEFFLLPRNDAAVSSLYW